jgi:hypothetical protein
MMTEPMTPDLEMSLRLDPFAPRAARHHVGLIDRPSPDLRDAVTLLTSEIVSHAVQRCESGDQDVQLRAWMPDDVVRVELRAAHELLDWPHDDRGAEYEVLLLDLLADRWSIEPGERSACMWFEIDRHAVTEEAHL